MMIKSLIYFSALTAWLLSGCSGLARAGIEATEEVYTRPYLSPTPLPECGQTTEVTINIEAVNDREVDLYITGLVPGERIYLVYQPVPVPLEGTILLESGPAKPAGQNGMLKLRQSHLDANQQPNTWQVRVIHQNGVACAEFTLPDE